jgi:hypothetical protein
VGHELTVGGAGGGELAVAFFKLDAQIGGLRHPGLVGCGGVHTYVVVVVTARNPRRRRMGALSRPGRPTGYG